MFLRFVIAQNHEKSHQPQGLFRTAYDLLDSGDLGKEEQLELRSLVTWFKTHLPIPDEERVGERAVFWYRDSACECIRQMWELANCLRSHGHAIELQTCRRLGNIVYSDELQVAAYRHERDAPIVTRTV